MIGFTVDKNRSWFDTGVVLKAAKRAEKKVMTKFGAFVRRSARSSLRKRKKISPPGNSPSSHGGQIKQFLYFVYEPHRSSVIIGPAILTDKRGAGRSLRALEQGGEVSMMDRKKMKLFRYRPRPFMKPAFDKEIPKVPALWAGTVKK